MGDDAGPLFIEHSDYNTHGLLGCIHAVCQKFSNRVVVNGSSRGHHGEKIKARRCVARNQSKFSTCWKLLVLTPGVRAHGQPSPMSIV